MVGILVMLNNYFHDFATAMLVVTTYVMVLIVRYASRSGAGDAARLAIALYPKMMHLTGATLVLLLMAGIVRSFTYSWFEWVGELGMAQIVLLGFKHVLMFSMVGYGIFVWVGVHKTVKAMKEEGGEVR